jgi:type IX secretion system PorP/SprF family membrane protein
MSGAYQAQETLPYYQQYLLDGDFLFNPAQYGKTDDIHVNLNYQKQFSKFDDSPNVQSVGVHANIYDRLGAGISIFRDANGPISSGGLTAGLSYFIPISDEGERKDQFSFGTSVSAYNMNFDYTKINVEITDVTSNIIINSISVFVLNLELSLYIDISRIAYIGIPNAENKIK